MKQKAPKVQLMWAVVRNGKVECVYPTREIARRCRFSTETIARIEVRVIK